MFDPRARSAYNSISAPGELRDRVLSAAEAPPVRRSTARPVKQLSALAACVVLVLAVSFALGTPGAPAISVDGQPLNLSGSLSLTEQPAPLSLEPRTLPVLSIPLELDLEEATELSVSHGALQIDDGNGAVESTKHAAFEKGECDLLWDLNPDEIDPNAVYTLSLAGEHHSETLTLEFDAAAGAWHLVRDEVKS